MPAVNTALFLLKQEKLFTEFLIWIEGPLNKGIFWFPVVYYSWSEYGIFTKMRMSATFAT